jgi:thiamine-phosphate diphosphorylase
MNGVAPLRGIYALVDPGVVEAVGFTEALLRAGVRVFQVRAKDGIDGATLIAIVSRVRVAGGCTIVNDDIGLARLADGVHLGQEDIAAIDLHEVRSALGKRIIGLSCGTPQEAAAADPRLVDYVGVGPLYATATKRDAGPPIGVDGARAVIAATSLPCAAIGGIGLDQLADVRATGAVMAAMASALVSDDPESTARACVDRWG